MEYIRLVHPENYDRDTGFFSDIEFKGKSADGSGMSLVQLECAAAASGGLICQHFQDKYSSVAAHPPIFLILSEAEFPDNVTLHNSPEFHPQKDPCHWDARSTTNDKQLKKLRKRPITDYSICENGVVRKVTQADVDSWP